MSVSLIPGVLLDRYAQLTPEWLKKRGITLLLSDLDYTLAPKSVRRPDDELKNWISMLQAGGITMKRYRKVANRILFFPLLFRS